MVVEVWVVALASVAAVSLLSLVGAVGLSLRALRRHGVLLVLVAVAAGTLMGDSFLHLLPEAVEAHGGFPTAMAGLVLGGFLALFGLEVLLRWRHAHAEMAEGPDGHAHQEIQPFGWTNLVGDAVHNLIDGVVIAAAYLVDAAVGLATTIAVAAHEIPQELGDFAVLLRSGMSPKKALALNFATALMAVLGASLVFLFPVEVGRLERVALPVIAGAFIYIAAADLVPELHHHSKGREVSLILTGFLAGLAIMYGLMALE